VDIGANEGYFSVLGGHLVGATGRIIAVEPQDRLLPILNETLRLNGLNNVSLYSVAISDADGMSDLHLSPDVNTDSTSLSFGTRYEVSRQPVQTTTLAKMLTDAEVGRVDLLKMDIEGFEYEAILGSRELFEKGRVRALALELHPQQMKHRDRNPTDLLEFLRAAGYQKDMTCRNDVFVKSALPRSM
jgi:FkbM family methyltransferase